MVAPSLKVTVPVVTGLPLLVTVAVKVTESPTKDGFSEEFTVVVVGAARMTVKFKHQPPASVPLEGPIKSSTIYRLQVPFGFRPLNADARVPVPSGAAYSADVSPLWVGKVSPAGVKLLGLKVPETSGPASGNCEAAASS